MRYFLSILLILLSVQAYALTPAIRAVLGVIGTGGAAGTTYVYPNNVSTFANTSGSVASTIPVADTIAGVTQTITKLGFYVGDPQTATECSVGIYNNQGDPTKYSDAGCHFTPAANTWGECTISFAMSSGTTYTIWAGCDQAYKVRTSASTCTNYYIIGQAYAQDMPATMTGRGADSGCDGLRMGY